MSDDNKRVGCWVSLVLRLAVASLFLAAAVSKLKGGAATITGTVDYFKSTFADSWLPQPMVIAHAYATPFIESLIVIWLVTGFKLRAGWVFAGLFLVTLSFGMAAAGKHDTAANNYTYVLIACLGLWVSQYDHFHLGQKPAESE